MAPVVAALVLAASVAAAAAAPPVPTAGEPYVYTHWETFGVADGLPDAHVFAITAASDAVWIGTEGGLARYAHGGFTSWTEKDGLPFPVVSSIAVSPTTGDVWLGLFGGGLARFTGGRFDHFHQLNSGLANDLVYGVAVVKDTVWAATTAGLSSYDTRTGSWEIFTDKNAPMEEIWCYNVSAADGKVYAAVWGGGVLERDLATGRFKAYHDPDRQMELDLFRDDGLIHQITTAVSAVDGVLWASTYFGLSRYDGRHWHGYQDVDSGLPSNFINFVKGLTGSSCACATDMGLAVLADYDTDTWVTYRRTTPDAGTWTALVGRGAEVLREVPTDLSLPNDFVIAVERAGEDLWIGTGHGLARGIGRGAWDGLKAPAAPEVAP